MESIKVRKGTVQDYRFIYQLHRSTMKEYISKTWGWDESWQEEYFHTHFNPKDCRIILFNNKEIGVLITRESTGEIFVREIQISPEFQNNGIGTHILKLLLDEAKGKNKFVALQVLKINPAATLYTRLGFNITGEDDLLYFMKA